RRCRRAQQFRLYSKYAEFVRRTEASSFVEIHEEAGDLSDSPMLFSLSQHLQLLRSGQYSASELNAVERAFAKAGAEIKAVVRLLADGETASSVSTHLRIA